jgi:hypothetical protein
MHRRGLRNLLSGFAVVLTLIALSLGRVFDEAAPLAWLMLLIVAAGVGSLWFFDSVRLSRQGKEFSEFAERFGWQYVSSSREYNSRFASFPFDADGASAQQNVLRGSLNGVPCVAFTQIRTERDAKGNEKSEPFSTTLVELPVRLPRIEIVPESFAEKFVKSLGGGDLDVESYEFNRRWRVLCRDPRYAHAVLDPRMVERLLQPDALDLAIRIEGGAVLAWQPGLAGTDTLARRFGVLTAVARRIPEHVVREYRERGALNVPPSERPIPPTAPAWATTPGALTGGVATGIGPGPPATGDGFHGLPHGGGGFDIFDALTFPWP